MLLRVIAVYADMDANKRCVICSSKSTKHCQQCNSACYCSKECQKKDWPTHKLICADFKNFDHKARPSPHHKLGIFFEKSTSKPQFMWYPEKNSSKEVGEFTRDLLIATGEMRRGDFVESDTVFTNPRTELINVARTIGCLRLVSCKSGKGSANKLVHQLIKAAGPSTKEKNVRFNGSVMLITSLTTENDVYTEPWGPIPEIKSTDINLSDYRWFIDWAAAVSTGISVELDPPLNLEQRLDEQWGNALS